jgi:hypothetical protein
MESSLDDLFKKTQARGKERGRAGDDGPRGTGRDNGRVWSTARTPPPGPKRPRQQSPRPDAALRVERRQCVTPRDRSPGVPGVVDLVVLAEKRGHETRRGRRNGSGWRFAAQNREHDYVEYWIRQRSSDKSGSTDDDEVGQPFATLF